MPASFARLASLGSLNLDGNRVAGLPATLLEGCARLQTLSLHSNPITAEQLEGTPGFEAYNARRKLKYDKQIAAGMTVGLDEGVDRAMR